MERDKGEKWQDRKNYRTQEAQGGRKEGQTLRERQKKGRERGRKNGGEKMCKGKEGKREKNGKNGAGKQSKLGFQLL